MTPKERLAAAKMLADQIYDSHGAGCCWHIVLDDCNLETSHVEWCMAHRADVRPQGYQCVTPSACAELGPLLLAMTEHERNEVRKEIYPTSVWPIPGEVTE